MAWTWKGILKGSMEAAYPIGTIYFNDGHYPAATLGIGTWVLLASGKLHVGSKNIDVTCWQRTE